MGCRDFFQGNAENNERCKALQSLDFEQQVAWESESASEYSPGPAGSDEKLSRQVLNPHHFDFLSDTIKPSFFDDASDKGASVNRLDHIEVETLRQNAQRRVDRVNLNPPSTGARVLIGYTTFSVEEVRSIFADSPPRRAFGVYDTARHDDRSHADVCQLVSSRQSGKSVRAQLFKIAKTRLVRFN